VDANQWDAQYAGDYAGGLDSIGNVPHHMVIAGYLTCAARDQPKILDIGCGHGRLLQLLAGLGFAEYLGVEWSAEAVEQARSLSIPQSRFDVADMDRWDTSERFDAIVLNESLTYSVDPRQMLERTLGWLAPNGIVIVSMFRGLGTRYIWSRVRSSCVEQLAACTVKDDASGGTWDVKVLRTRHRDA
jgi:2-polyprenyl-3-methyl-5-hydroxy-6-metoxy-1,4-benzoquinol methylase